MTAPRATYAARQETASAARRGWLTMPAPPDRPHTRAGYPDRIPETISALDAAGDALNPVSGLQSRYGAEVSALMSELGRLRAQIALTERAAPHA